MGYILNPSSLKPKPCRCTKPAAMEDGRCVWCGKQVKGHEVKPPSAEESIVEVLRK